MGQYQGTMLVIEVYRQIEGIIYTETFSLVLKPSMVKIILSLVVTTRKQVIDDRK